MTKFLLILIFIALSMQSFAADGSSRDFLIYPNKSSGAPVHNESQDLTVVYDGQKLSETELYLPNEKSKILDMLKIKIMNETLTIHNNITVPLAPQSVSDLDKLNDLSGDELKTFLRKKETWLQNIAKVFKKLNVSPLVANKILKEANQKIYNSTKSIAKSNTGRKPVYIAVSAGIALPQYLVAKLKQTPIGRFIPDSGGFYYLFGFGGSLYRKVNPATLKKELFIEFLTTKEELVKSMSGVLDLSLNLYMGSTQEFRASGAEKTQKVLITNLGAAGSMRTGTNHAGWTVPIGIGAIPVVGWFLVHENNAVLNYHGDWNITNTWEKLMGKIGVPEQPIASACSPLF